jgi:hypothetical protein
MTQWTRSSPTAAAKTLKVRDDPKKNNTIPVLYTE